MSKSVFVSGYGIISALGKNANENLMSLQKSQTGIARPEYLQTNHSDMMVGEVKASNADLSKLADTGTIKSRTALLGLIAAREAINHAALKDYKSAALINGTSVGGMDITEHAYASLVTNKEVDYKTSFNGHDCGHSTQAIAESLGLNGYLSTISTACSSSANTIMHGARLIKSGMVDCAIVGGTDALSLFTLNGFNSLKILDTDWCRPFDEDRKGLNLGEGAAFLVLESDQHLKNRNGKPIAELVGYGNANDAYHQTASSPEGKGAYAAMSKALEVANIEVSDIDYINAHGTGTSNNDQSESLAIQKIFGEKAPPFSSTKAFTGHTLGAAGSIEAVFSIMAIQQQHVFPNLNVKNFMKLLGTPVSAYQTAKIDYVLSNSFGFGGNCSSLIFTSV